jgi:hypothetical protein
LVLQQRLGLPLDELRLARDDLVADLQAELLCYRRAADPVARVCVPASCRAQVLEAAHGGSSLTGHPGIARTAAAVARFF